MDDSYFIEVAYKQRSNDKHQVCGDVFLSEKVNDEGRVISVLADGLGSGIKASVLATMTATMASKFMTSNMDIIIAAENIMNTLPICSERKIAYSTFTIIDIDPTGYTKVVEFDNPTFLLIRNKNIIPVRKKTYHFKSPTLGKISLQYSEFQADPEDRIVFYSDGVVQSGMGTRRFPMGWTDEAASEFVLKLVQEEDNIDASELAEKVLKRALVNNGFHANDDITCAVIYARKPRKLLVFTGPPYDMKNDVVLAQIYSKFEGKTVICGGTTAKILSRELDKKLKIDLGSSRSSIPPWAEMEGFDLITEGTITLSHISRILSDEIKPHHSIDAVQRLYELLLSSDIIKFIVGTRINEAHQDPKLPENLDIRKNIIKRIASKLEKKFLKKVAIEYI